MMSRGESSKNSVSKGTPVKALKRDVRGLLSLQQESPSQSDVIWSSLDSPHKSRAVGGKSKSLKSSNQLTPKNNAIRKKYYSSPILVARVPDDNNEEFRKLKNIENQRILEEFHRQFSNENYVPRNLLDNLEEENLEDSIVAPDAKINEQKSDNIKDEIDKLTDYNLTDQEDFEVLAEMEEQARQFLIKKETQSITKVTSNKPETQMPKSNEPAKSFNFKNPTPTPITSNEKKVTNNNDYFDSDDDDIILSIPLEQLTAENSKPNTLSNNINKKEQPAKSNNFGHTSVIPTRRENINVITDKNRISNQSNSKPSVQSKSVADNATSEPLAKRRCTAEEIAEKRRLAMQRREAFLQNIKVTQKMKH
ncbi:repetitive organellar protein-like [Chironomus tepperi]|uniref:repetitive organellar protein-like n=1 Tax=Chironomus tepperi TaxID=113505 RepID=UPI00391F2FE5